MRRHWFPTSRRVNRFFDFDGIVLLYGEYEILPWQFTHRAMGIDECRFSRLTKSLEVLLELFGICSQIEDDAARQAYATMDEPA